MSVCKGFKTYRELIFHNKYLRYLGHHFGRTHCPRRTREWRSIGQIYPEFAQKNSRRCLRLLPLPQHFSSGIWGPFLLGWILYLKVKKRQQQLRHQQLNKPKHIPYRSSLYFLIFLEKCLCLLPKALYNCDITGSQY